MFSFLIFSLERVCVSHFLICRNPVVRSWCSRFGSSEVIFQGCDYSATANLSFHSKFQEERVQRKKESEAAAGVVLGKRDVLKVAVLKVARWNLQSKNYASGSENPRFLNMPRVLSMQEFWIDKGSEYASVIQGSEYVWICLNNSWICLKMPEDAAIYVNITKSVWMTFVLHFPILISLIYELEPTKMVIWLRWVDKTEYRFLVTSEYLSSRKTQ